MGTAAARRAAGCAVAALLVTACAAQAPDTAPQAGASGHPPVTVDPRLGRGTQTLRPDPPLDPGSTGRLGTTAWRRR
ncbi:hypothetical protein [Streptomyces sp. NPDC006552]|uniref:hypothetical protein n=1 Tax=Streptomyces sp. NPDC006552 TaxID=3157179 RepID=UPI0033B54FFA